MRRWGIAIVMGWLASAAPAPVQADIYEWRDAAGLRHYTNVLADVPAEQQAAARKMIVEPPASSARAESPPAAAVPPHLAEVVVDPASLRDAYAEGVREGAALAARAPVSGGSVQINGPLAVSIAEASRAPRFEDALPYPPLVTTSFDRGRSRHQTLRMVLQDQFQFDRDGPFVYEGLIPPGPGPALHTRLPRGLPHEGRGGPRVRSR